MRTFIFILFIIFSNSILAQEITSRLVDEKGNPVAYATIQTGRNAGVISNREGYFTISESQVNGEKITISCLGYTQKIVTISELKQSDEIILKEFTEELRSVYLSNSNPNVDEIMRMVRENLTKNYSDLNIEHRLFFRNTSYINFGDLNFELDKVSGLNKKQLASTNKSMDSLTRAIKSSKAIHFKDYLADLKIKDNSNSKIDVKKATKLIDMKKDVSIDQVQNKAQTIFLKYLDTTKTFKVKTGIIKIEDSLSFSDMNNDMKEAKKTRYNVKGLRSESLIMIKKSQIYDGSRLSKLLNADLYEYTFRDVTFYNDELIYIIDFEPRRSKAKLAGTLYVADETFAVVRSDYEYADGKRGKKFNLKLLLGIKYIENHYKGTMTYQKDENDIYRPQYIHQESGNYFFVRRPIKFIENSPQKNKVAFEFTIEGDTREKNEVLIVSSKDLNESEFSSFTQPEYVDYINLDRYNPEIYKDYTSLEPLEEMKTFKSEEK